MSFDADVKRIRSHGVKAKCIRKRKAECTPEQWAAHREYMAERYRDPRCRAMHVGNQIKYLCNK